MVVPHHVLSRNIPFGIAHRGGNVVAPGNTMASFKNAIELGFTFLETDVRLSLDGVLVISHDDTFIDDLQNSYSIKCSDWLGLKDLKIDGHNLVLLEELIAEFPKAYFNLEPKSDESVIPLAEFISKNSLSERVCVGSFKDSRIKILNKYFDGNICVSPGPIAFAWICFVAIVFPWKKVKYDVIQIPTQSWILRFDSKFLIKRFHKLNLQVHYWTINEKAEIIRLINNGADAIISDNLSTLKSVLDDFY